jgi:hypothetical protein
MDEREPLDWLAVRVIAAAAPEDKPRLAKVFGEADTIGRHLPLYATAGAARACWLMVCAIEAEHHGDPWARVLMDAARTALLEAARPMEPLVMMAPANAAELTDGH